MYDGAAFNKLTENDRPKAGSHLVYPLTLSSLTTTSTTYEDGGLYIKITKDTRTVDDEIVACVKNDLMSVCSQGTYKDVLNLIEESVQQATLPEICNHFSHACQCFGKQGKSDQYAVIRRTGYGGTKTNKHLFERLHLRRPHEGALCLMPSLWPNLPVNSNKDDEITKSSKACVSLEEDGLLTIRELQNVSKVHQLLEFQLRPVKLLRSIVVTNDVLLADRVVKEGGAVLSYRQFEQALLW